MYILHPAGNLGFGIASFQGLCLFFSDGVFAYILGLLWGRVEGQRIWDVVYLGDTE